jgi:hypothetical protein
MRKIMGPAMLVTVGTLFLLESLNVANFERTWPAILLVIGVVKLLQSNASMAGHVERMGAMPAASPFAPVPPAPPVPPSAPPPIDPGGASSSPSSSSGEVSHG